MRLLWLQECPGVGPAVLRAAIAKYGGAPPVGFFGRHASWYIEALGVPEKLAATLERHLSAVPASLAEANKLPASVVTLFDPAYPSGLRRLNPAPPLVLLHGNASFRLLFGNFCVISSSKREWEHAELIKAGFDAALTAGWRLVAGHNRPVYQWALLAAKRRGAAATMVLDRGLLAAFDDDLRRDPVPSARIWGYAFDAARSLAVSPFRLRDPWIGANARYRDALVVALSDTILAVGIQQGGTMHRLCREAAMRGQRVFASEDSLPLLAPAGAVPWQGELAPPGSDGTTG
jgi:predicted Rossmann fold nucleotide-binding protein DprA/Smf involved in DNA uptake